MVQTEEMVFWSATRDKSRPDFVSSDVKKQPFETNKLLINSQGTRGLATDNFTVILHPSVLNDSFFAHLLLRFYRFKVRIVN